MEFKTDEIAMHGLAEPIAEFRLGHPVFPLLVVGKGPAVEVAVDIECPAGCHLELQTKVHIGQGVIDKIGLDSRGLRFGSRGEH